MNNIIFNQTGGFPLETDTLDAMQVAYSIFNDLGNIAGNLSIISGCNDTGSSVTDGVVYINGELLKFQGGVKSANVVIVETSQSRVFEDGQSKPVYKTRYATFGSASQQWAWSSFTRINPIKEIQKAVVPVGMISMWSGSTGSIPSGWFLCNGSNGTPNLRDRFVVGAGGTYNVGDTGGAKDVTLTEAQMPSHKHSGSTNSNGSHSHTGKTALGGSHTHSISLKKGESDGGNSGNDLRPSNSYGQSVTQYTNSAGTHDHSINLNSAGAHTHSFETNQKGSSQSHENRPPYYALAYIMFKG